MPRQYVFNAITAESVAGGIWEDRVRGLTISLSDLMTQSNNNFLAQRDAACFASLADAPHVSAGYQHHVLTPETNQLRNTEAGLQRYQQQCPIAALTMLTDPVC